MIKQHMSLFIAGVFLMLTTSCDQPSREGRLEDKPNSKKLMSDNNGANDFDFLANKNWKVQNRVLKARLSNNNEWDEFEAEFYGYQKIAGGYGNVDQFKGVRNGLEFEASSIRTFNKNSGEWSIYWIDNISTKLIYQVTGKFENGIGTFFGEEPFNGKMAKLRFLWSDITDTSARWEQAYYDSLANKWETNWIMEFHTD